MLKYGQLGRYSSELVQLVPQPFSQGRSTFCSDRLHDFCIFVKSTDFKICQVITGIATKCKLHLCLVLLNPTYYQHEIGKSNTSA